MHARTCGTKQRFEKLKQSVITSIRGTHGGAGRLYLGRDATASRPPRAQPPYQDALEERGNLVNRGRQSSYGVWTSGRGG